jgi:hypothetical protein
MNKINPLRKIQGLPEPQTEDRKVSRRKGGQVKAFDLDRVEISAVARQVQKAESIRKSVAPEWMDDAERLSLQWYRTGYHLLSDENV